MQAVDSLRTGLRTIKRLGRACVGKEVFVRRDVRCKYEIFGNAGAAFGILPNLLSSRSIVYSFGIGTDISFDLTLVRRFGLEVHAFDPTPRSLAWLKTQTLPPLLHVHEYGISNIEGLLPFSEPACPNHVSHTLVARAGLAQAVTAPVRRLRSIMRDLGHTSLDLLKMDIEGAEYGVISDMLESGVLVRQLCVEFHHRWPEIGSARTAEAIRSLREVGYRIFLISPDGEEYCFVQAAQ